jgi:hypothetical protein
MQVLRATVMIAAKAAAGEKPIFGLNANSIFNRSRLYDELFQRPKMIAIVRNPVDSAVSAWHHNKRLAIEEGDPEHEALLANAEGTLDGYVKKRAEVFSRAVRAYLDATEGHSNFLLVRYETLVSDKKSELQRLFSFLGATTAGDLLDRIVRESAPDAMARASASAAFFGLGASGSARETASPKVREEVLRTAAPELDRLGYVMSDLLRPPARHQD